MAVLLIVALCIVLTRKLARKDLMTYILRFTEYVTVKKSNTTYLYIHIHNIRRSPRLLNL